MTAMPDSGMETLPSPPRPIDARIRRRAWGDPVVRWWWGTAVLLTLFGAGMIYSELLVWRHVAGLVQKGTVIDADAIEVNEDTVRTTANGLGRPKPPSSPVVLEFDWKGSKRQLKGYLDGRTEIIFVGQKVPIRVNPDDLDDWTARTQNPPLLAQMIGGLILIGLGVPVMVVSVYRWKSTLRIWHDGEELEASVVRVFHTAVAPRTRAVKCAVPGNQAVVQTVYVPDVRWPAGAESIQVLRGAKGGRVLAARWFR